ncbi:MAG TPA: L,D-transpeptidase family protein [Actinomycetota bacterium]|nr:L,D-transpeptidase family protein [Actinomycetota bacterium]
MRSRQGTLVGICVALAVGPLLVLVPPAQAQATDAVTLQADRALIPYGSSVQVTGTVSPPSGGESVQIQDQTPAVLTTATTAPDGSFSATLQLQASSTLQASWNGVVSDPVSVRVRAKVSVRLRNVRLFDRAVARGSVDPAPSGTTVHLTLLLWGRIVARREVTVSSSGAYRARFPISDPGTYRVRAASRPSGLARGTGTAGPVSTPLPSLKVGSRGSFVRALERRLVALHYHLIGVDTTYDARTADAVMAFRKVQGMPRTGTVDAAVWRRLADPRIPKPRFTAKAFHIEVDQTRQVLYTVRGGEVTNVIHVSTGANGATHDGSFRVHRKLAGFSPNGLYYPSYFDGLRAIHGWTEVPSYPASHGCVRVPYWDARWIFRLAVLGTRVFVYH